MSDTNTTDPLSNTADEASQELAKKSAIKTVLFGVASTPPRKARHPYELINEDDDHENQQKPIA